MSAKTILLAQFDFHNRLFNNVVEQITDEEANVRLLPSMNNFKWLAGHLTGTQTHFARMGGVSVDFPWADHFPLGPGAPKVENPDTPLPTIEDIVAKWNEFHPVIRQGLENLPEAASLQILLK